MVACDACHMESRKHVTVSALMGKAIHGTRKCAVETVLIPDPASAPPLKSEA